VGRQPSRCGRHPPLRGGRSRLAGPRHGSGLRRLPGSGRRRCCQDPDGAGALMPRCCHAGCRAAWMRTAGGPRRSKGRRFIHARPEKARGGGDRRLAPPGIVRPDGE